MLQENNPDAACTYARKDEDKTLDDIEESLVI